MVKMKYYVCCKWCMRDCVIVPALKQRMPVANDRYFVVAATIIAACSAMVDGMRLVAQPLLAIIMTDPFLASTLVALRPRFFGRRCSTLIALCPLPRGCIFFYCCILCTLIGSHGGHDHNHRDCHRRHRCIIDNTIDYRHVVCDPGASVSRSPTCVPRASYGSPLPGV